MDKKRGDLSSRQWELIQGRITRLANDLKEALARFDDGRRALDDEETRDRLRHLERKLAMARNRIENIEAVAEEVRDQARIDLERAWESFLLPEGPDPGSLH